MTDTTRQPGVDGRTGTVEPVADPLAHAGAGFDDGVPEGYRPPDEPDPLASSPAAADPSLSPVHDEQARHSPVPVVEHLAAKPGRTATTTSPERTGSGVRLATISRTGDLVFGGLTKATAVVLVALVAFVGIFLLVLALPSILADQDNFFLSRSWQVSGGDLRFGILGLLWTTVLSSVVALVIAVPVAVGVALCLTQYLPKRVAGPVGFLVELLAAVPSIIFGLWGLTVFGPFLGPIGAWIGSTLGFIPLFDPVSDPKSTVFVAGIVLAIMVLPIITSISKNVFEQTPRDQTEAALALGATRWEVIRTSVLPYGRSGVISASMLGLGRALGETIAVLIILSQPAPGSAFTPSIFAGGETFASKIANNASEFDSPSKTGAYIAAGLVLFVVTFLVNAAARTIADRGVK
ncbi:phosphate ABC transporter permease subunit PstC [Microlunatus spumicola]|uniref:Phosphate transport system permease protein n=1 Tax=Microlunatus spumicola TaxID=81499 RepID=A0ABP6XWT5_9ACTN